MPAILVNPKSPTSQKAKLFAKPPRQPDAKYNSKFFIFRYPPKLSALYMLKSPFVGCISR